jgi:hypothetical protein
MVLRREDPELVLYAIAYVEAVHRDLTAENTAPSSGVEGCMIAAIRADPALSDYVRTERWGCAGGKCRPAAAAADRRDLRAGPRVAATGRRRTPPSPVVRLACSRLTGAGSRSSHTHVLPRSDRTRAGHLLSPLWFLGSALLIFGAHSKPIISGSHHQQIAVRGRIVRGPSRLAQLARPRTVFFRVHAEPSVSPRPK